MPHQTGESLRLTATITDTAGAAADPTTVVISIVKPDSTLDIDAVAMTKAETGSYYYDYTIPANEGTYRVAVKATGSAGKITIEPDTFDAANAL